MVLSPPQVQSLVGELRSCKPCGTAKRRRGGETWEKAVGSQTPEGRQPWGDGGRVWSDAFATKEGGGPGAASRSQKRSLALPAP